MQQAYSYIRFSSDKQELGDSLRRQLKLAEDYALENNLTLDTHSYRDLGISAFNGKNLREGALGAFLHAVDTGIIPKNSTLLVENLDRLSRAAIDEALELFMSIIRRGITIVTLQDKQVYSTERIKVDRGISIIISITYMMRAHEESAAKSVRVKAAWDAKRASKVPVKNCPSWLQVNDAGTAYVQVTEKVKTVKKIFELASEGNGIYLIYKYLNEHNIPQLGNAKLGWVLPSVARVLHNQATIGRLVSLKNGTVIEDYYPAIIDKNVFFAVQEKITERHKTGQGRKGENVANLFSGLITCGDCKSHMRFTRTPTAGSKKINVYLQCVDALLKKGCTAKRLNYESIEKALLHDLLIMWNIEFSSETAVLADPTIAIRAEMADKNSQIERLLDLIEQEGERESRHLHGRYTKRVEELSELAIRLRNTVVPQATEDVLAEAKKAYEEHQRLQETPGPGLRDARLRLQGVIKKFIEKIELPSKIEYGYEVVPKKYRIALTIFRTAWLRHLYKRDFGGIYNDDQEFEKDLLVTLGSAANPFETWYEVPNVGFPLGNLRGRPKKKAPVVS